MDLSVSDEIFKEIVRHAWEDIACFAYNSFVKNGRGVVKIRKIRDAETVEAMEFKMAYCAWDDASVAADAEAAKLVREYAPEKELVAQYLRSDGNLHTALVKTPSEDVPPKIFDLFRGFSFEDIFSECGGGLTYSPESVYARAQKMTGD